MKVNQFHLECTNSATWIRASKKVRLRVKERVSSVGLRWWIGLWCLLYKQVILAAIGATCAKSYLSHSPTTLNKVIYRRSVERREWPCNTGGQSECVQVAIWRLLTTGGAIWSRSSDGPFWSFEGEHENYGWGEYSQRGTGIDKCHVALISWTAPPPACPPQSGTHVWCWSAGAYPIMD